MNLSQLQNVAILYDIDLSAGVTTTVHGVHTEPWHEVDRTTEVSSSVPLIVVQVHLGSVDALLTTSGQRNFNIPLRCNVPADGNYTKKR